MLELLSGFPLWFPYKSRVKILNNNYRTTTTANNNENNNKKYKHCWMRSGGIFASHNQTKEKILNKQFCAATSILLSSTGRFIASPFLRSTNSDLNQSFCSSAILKFL